MLAPLAPHIACELWPILGGKGCVLDTEWPVAGQERAQTEVVAIQINGKLRGTLPIATPVFFLKLVLHCSRNSRFACIPSFGS